MTNLRPRIHKVSVVIPSFNNSEMVIRLIQSIATLERPINFQLGITVVDDGSSSKHAKLLSTLSNKGAKVVRSEKNKGKLFSINMGIGQSKGDWCWVLSPELVCDNPKSLITIDNMLRMGRQIILGHVSYSEKTLLNQVHNLRLNKLEKLSIQQAFDINCFVVNKAKFFSCGALDTELGAGRIAEIEFINKYQRIVSESEWAISESLVIRSTGDLKLQDWFTKALEDGKNNSDALYKRFPTEYKKSRYKWFDCFVNESFVEAPVNLICSRAVHSRKKIISLISSSKCPTVIAGFILELLWLSVYHEGTHQREQKLSGLNKKLA